MPENCIKLNLDTNQRIHNGTRYAKQGDAGSRRLEVTVTCDSAPVDLTGCRAVFYAKKPSWKGVYNDASITDAAHGVISVELTDQTLAEAGRLQCEITLYGPENSILSTLCTDEILVSPTVRDDEAIESTNEFTALTRAMSEVSDAAGRAQAQADAAEAAADKAAEIYHQVLSDLEAGNLKGDKGNTGPTGPTGPRGFPGGVARMRTLSLPCTVPIGVSEDRTALSRCKENLFHELTEGDWSTEDADKAVINHVTWDGGISVTCNGAGAAVTTPVIHLSLNNQYTITRDISMAPACGGTLEIMECDPTGIIGRTIFSHSNGHAAQRSYLFTATCPYIKIRWTMPSPVYGKMEIRYDIKSGNPYGLTESAEGADLGLSFRADESALASVRLKGYDSQDAVTVISQGLNLFDPKTAADWSTDNDSKTRIKGVTEDGAVNIICWGEGMPVTTPVIPLSLNKQYTITREVSKGLTCTGKFEIIECSAEGTEGEIVFSHNNTLSDQRSYLFTATCPYIKIRWANSLLTYEELEIRYEINEGNPYGLQESAVGSDLGLTLKPYQYVEAPYSAAGIEIPVFAGGLLAYRSEKGTVYAAQAELKTSTVTLLETTLEEGVDLIEIDRYSGRAILGLSEAVIAAGRVGEASRVIVRQYAPGAKKITEYGEDIGVGGTLQPGDTIMIKGA